MRLWGNGHRFIFSPCTYRVSLRLHAYKLTPYLCAYNLLPTCAELRVSGFSSADIVAAKKLVGVSGRPCARMTSVSAANTATSCACAFGRVYTCVHWLVCPCVHTCVCACQYRCASVCACERVDQWVCAFVGASKRQARITHYGVQLELLCSKLQGVQCMRIKARCLISILVCFAGLIMQFNL